MIFEFKMLKSFDLFYQSILGYGLLKNVNEEKYHSYEFIICLNIFL
jgi:hypothetical protein